MFRTPRQNPCLFPEVCEAMDIMLSTNVVATVIGLTGTANACDECWRRLSQDANSDVRAIFLDAVSCLALALLLFPLLQRLLTTATPPSPSFELRLGSKMSSRPRLDWCKTKDQDQYFAAQDQV